MMRKRNEWPAAPGGARMATGFVQVELLVAVARLAIQCGPLASGRAGARDRGCAATGQSTYAQSFFHAL